MKKKVLIIHHSATGNNVSDEVIKSWDYYNLAIKPDGVVIYLKDKLNFRKDDRYSYDAVLIGNFEIDGSFPTQEQINSLQAIVVSSGAEYLGHREIKDFNLYDPKTGKWPTACPGKNLMPYIINFRQPMKKLILIKNNTSDNRIPLILQETRDWFKAKGEEIEFGNTNTPWAVVNVYSLVYATGGCGENKPYQISLIMGELKPNTAAKLSDILIHEILHAYFFDAGLGDLHNIMTPERPMGLGGCYQNDYNIEFYLKSVKIDSMKINQDQLKKLYLLVFKREPDEGGAKFYEGKELDFILNEFLISKEHQYYTPLFLAAKKIEKELK